MNLLLGVVTAFIIVSQASPVTSLPSVDSGSGQCGADQLTWHNVRSFDVGNPGSVSVRATAPDGSVVFDLYQPLQPGERLIPVWCGDLLGDGRQVFGYERFSGGAHCCYSASVVPLTPGAAHLLDVDLGNGGLLQPEQLDATGPLALVGSSDVFAYFDDLTFAASPFMPLVYAYDGDSQQYVEATRQYPDRLKAEVARARADLAAAKQQPADPNTPAALRDQVQKSVALRLYGLHVLLGDDGRALPRIEWRVAKPVAAWLAANAPAAKAAMGNVYTLS